MFKRCIAIFFALTAMMALALSQTATWDSPQRKNASKDLGLPNTAKPGDQITLKVTGVNPMLYEIHVGTREIPVFPLPPGITQANVWQPSQAGGGADEVVKVDDKILIAILAADKNFRDGNSPYLIDLPSLKEPLEKAYATYVQWWLATHPGNTDPLHITNQPITETTILSLATAYKAMPKDANGNPADTDIDTTFTNAWKLYSNALAVASATPAFTTTLTVPASADLAVTVRIVPRAVVSDTSGNAIDSLAIVNSGLQQVVSDEGTIHLEGFTRNNWTAAVFLNGVHDESYGFQTTNDTTVIAKKGSTDQASVYVGTLYHFPLTKRIAFSMGVGTNGQKLMYFAGPSFPLGDPNAPGYLSIGAVAAQVTRLDGVDLGDTVTDTTKPIPTKSVFKIGFGVALSFRF